MIITLPFPPSVNCLFNGGTGQKRFPSKKYKAWLLSCPLLPPKRLSGVKLTFKYYFPDNRARDLDNLGKAVADLLVKSQVIIDDSWQHVKELSLVSMGIDKHNSRVEITVEVL